MKYVLILAILVFASCGQVADTKGSDDKNNAQSAEVGRQKLIENALTFINAYVDNCNKVNQSIGVVEWANANNLATQGFKTALKKIVDEAYKADPELGLDADPIFDAQDYPDKGFELESLDEQTNYIVVKGKGQPEFKLTMKMMKNNNDWLVDGCGIINVPNDKRSSR